MQLVYSAPVCSRFGISLSCHHRKRFEMLSCVFTQAVFGMKEEEADLAGAIIAARISLLPFVKGKRLPRGGGVTTSLLPLTHKGSEEKQADEANFFPLVPSPLLVAHRFVWARNEISVKNHFRL